MSKKLSLMREARGFLLPKNKEKGDRFIVAVAIVGVLLASAFCFFVLRYEHDAHHERLLEAALTSTAVLERDVNLILEYANSYLDSVRREFQKNSEFSNAIDYIQTYPPSESFFTHVTMIDRNGVPVFNSAYPLREGVNVSDRDYFQHFASGAEDALLIPLSNQGRNSGRIVVRMVKPLLSADGEFSGVVFTAAPDEVFVRLFEAFDFGEMSTATVVGLDRRIRSRNFYGDLGPGQDISGSQIWDRIAEADQGHYRQVSVVDGIERIYTYSVLETYPLVVALGIPLTTLVGDPTDFELMILMFFLFAVTVIILSAILLIRERQNSQKIMRSSQAKTDFLGHMSHELRTPLNSVIGFADVMEQEVFGKLEPSRYGGYVQNIKASGQHLLNLIDDILDLVKVEAGKRDIHPQILNPVVEVQACLQMLERDLQRKQILVHLPESNEKLGISFDQRMFRQVCLNILSNAIKFSPARGRIFVKVVQTSSGHLSISFKDEGCGIAAEDLALVMEPFGQARKSIEISTPGVGLGLPLSRLFVERNGGKLELESEIGLGTTVIIHLPPEGDLPG